MVDSHKITERTSLLYHQGYAVEIGRDDSYIEVARTLIDSRISSYGGTVGEQMWQRLLTKPWPQVRSKMLADTPDGRLLRSNSPFSMILGIRDPDVRRRLWRKAKQDLLAETT